MLFVASLEFVGVDAHNDPRADVGIRPYITDCHLRKKSKRSRNTCSFYYLNRFSNVEEESSVRCTL